MAIGSSSLHQCSKVFSSDSFIKSYRYGTAVLGIILLNLPRSTNPLQSAMSLLVRRNRVPSSVVAVDTAVRSFGLTNVLSQHGGRNLSGVGRVLGVASRSRSSGAGCVRQPPVIPNRSLRSLCKIAYLLPPMVLLPSRSESTLGSALFRKSLL